MRTLNNSINIKRGILVIAAAAVVTAAVLGAVKFASTDTAYKIKETVHSSVQEAKPVNPYIEYTRENGVKAHVTPQLKQSDGYKAFADEFSEKIPASVVSATAECTIAGVTMYVKTDSFEYAEKAIDELRKFKTLNNLVVGSIIQTTDAEGNSDVSFSAAGTYVPQGDVTNPVINAIVH